MPAVRDSQPLTLTIAMGSTSRFGALLSGDLSPHKITLAPSVLSVADIFWLMPESEPFDVAEMSITGYLWAIQHGKRWTALPVFPDWVYGCHADTLVNVNSGIERPEDLRGKRVGVPEYAVAAIAWIRDAWEQDAGVGRAEIFWCEERTPEASHYRPWGYRPPEHISVEIIPREARLSDMLISGEVDAVTRYFGGLGALERAPQADRSPLTIEALSTHPNVRWLYSDRAATAHNYHSRVGSPQPIHCIVIKDDVIERHPWVVRSLYDAFIEAAARTREAASVLVTSFPFPPSEQQRRLGEDFFPCGLGGRNRIMIERLIALAVEDGLVIGQPPAVEELFPPQIVND